MPFYVWPFGCHKKFRFSFSFLWIWFRLSMGINVHICVCNKNDAPKESSECKQRKRDHLLSSICKIAQPTLACWVLALAWPLWLHFLFVYLHYFGFCLGSAAFSMRPVAPAPPIASAKHIRNESRSGIPKKSTERASHCVPPRDSDAQMQIRGRRRSNRYRYSDTDTHARTKANPAEHLDCRIQSECRAVAGRGWCGGGFLDQLLNLAIKLPPAKSAEPRNREQTERIASSNVA